MSSHDARPESRPEHDVIVVGAGPAGATAAYYLALPAGGRAGLRVALLEKERFPRDKICGDAWCAPALDILEEMGVLQQLEAEGLVQDCTSGGFVSPSGESYVATGEAGGAPGTRCYAIKRMICDERIARRAERAGAQLYEEADFERAELADDGLWSVQCRDGRRFRARMLVAADGATSRVARSLGVVETPPEGVASRQYVRGGTHNFKSGGVLLYPEYILPGYVALFRHYDDVIDLGAYVIPGGALAPEELLDVYRERIMRDPFIQRVLGPRAEFLERVRVASLRTGGEPRSSARQFMAVGDAAGQTDPLTGEGIHTGMIGARLAAQTIHELFERRDFSAQACALYHRRWMKAFGREFPASAAGGRMTHRFPLFLDAANVVAQRRGDGFMAEFGAAMTGVKPKTTFVKPGVALPLGAEVVRQVFVKFVKSVRRPFESGWQAYETRGRARSGRDTAFENAGLRDPAVVGGPEGEGAAAGRGEPEALARIFRHAARGPVAGRVLVVYASEYGFAQELAERVCAELAELRVGGGDARLSPVCVDARLHEIVDWAEVDVCLMLCSTAGDGVAPRAARGLFERIGSGALDLSGVRYSVLALGDRSYPNFCRAGRKLDSLMGERGAQPLTPVVQVDREDALVIGAWQQTLAARMSDAGFWRGRGPGMDERRLRERAARRLGAETGAAGVGASRERPLRVRLASRRPLCRRVEPGDRDTVHVELDPGGDDSLDWQPGDALGVLANNCPSEVQAVLAALGRSGDEAAEEAEPEAGASLRDALLRRADIKRLRPELGKALAVVAEAPDERERLAALRDDAAGAAGYWAERELQDVLHDFPLAARQLRPGELLRCLGRIAPRYYSIASAPETEAGRLSLAVAIVRYEALGRSRTGLASSYLGERVKPGDEIDVFVQPNPDFRLPAGESGASCVMIGAGTGLAPYRAFLQTLAGRERRAPHLLFCGCRHRDRDFLYAEQWQSWADAGLLEIFPAFSRDQEQKVYVQHRLREQAPLVWRRMQAGDHFYVCGDATAMAPDVEKALCEIVRTEGGASQGEAGAYLDAMREGGRLQKDVWAV